MNARIPIAVIGIIIVCIIIYMYLSGGVYVNRIKECNQAFCGLSQFVYAKPSRVHAELNALIDGGHAKRVNIAGWKAGQTIPTQVIVKHAPHVIEWYHAFAQKISKIVGVKVDVTPLTMPTSCSVLIYDEEADFINWHFDVNYFNGRFFTVLLPITNELTCTKFVYKNAKEQDTPVDIRNDNCVVFEGEKVFHMASRLCKGERRAILSLQYSTDASVSLMNQMMMRLKDLAYIGIK